MNYQNYTVNDFVTDKNFQRWVKEPYEDDHKFWERWTVLNPDKKDIIDEAVLMVRLLDFQKRQSDMADFEEIKANINDHIKRRTLEPSHSASPSKYTANQYPYWKKIAALFVGVTIMGLLYYFFVKEQPFIHYATDFGEIQSITLPDGSMATLNANTKLKVSKNWEASRDVWLDGEAFFEVKKITGKVQDNRPAQRKKFIVHTHHLDVEVLGTTFNVNERRGMTRVVLNTGSVQLIRQTEKDTTSIPMKPGELVEFEEANKNFRKQLVNPELVSVWKENRFVFVETSLLEIVRMLEDNYGYRVTIRQKDLAQRKFTASLPSRDIDFLLALISELLDIKVSKTGDKIIMESKQ